jgi:hypothetical protein
VRPATSARVARLVAECPDWADAEHGYCQRASRPSLLDVGWLNKDLVNNGANLSNAK